MKHLLRPHIYAVFGLALLVNSAALNGQTAATGERFRAFAVNMDSMVGRTGAQAVEIVVERWSTEGEVTRLLSA